MNPNLVDKESSSIFFVEELFLGNLELVELYQNGPIYYFESMSFFLVWYIVYI